jgi:hypothetical protein
VLDQCRLAHLDTVGQAHDCTDLLSEAIVTGQVIRERL